jgi:hypothetical protein
MLLLAALMLFEGDKKEMRISKFASARVRNSNILDYDDQ